MLAAFLAYAAIFLPGIADSEGRGGPDYGYFVPQLLAGYFWFEQNGLWSIPWFTPGICGGMPYYANIQTMYLSLPQFLTIVFGPTLALKLTFLVFAASGLIGTYFLLRVRYQTSDWAAVTGAILFLFNGFFAFRLLAGHLTFHAFMLAPIVAYAILGARQDGRPWRSCVTPWVVAAALLIAYMVQSGMVHALPPLMAGLLVFILIHALVLHSSPWISIARLLAASSVALLLSVSKLTAGIAFLGEFPRNMLPLIGFDGLGRTLLIAFKSVFIFPSLVEGTDWIRNNAWYPGENVILPFHEYAYTVTFIPLLVILASLPWGAKRIWFIASKPGFAGKLAIGALVLAILAVPIFLNWHSPAWTAFLKSVPVLKSSSTLIRWFSLYVLVSVVVTALIVDRFSLIKSLAPLIAVVTLGIAVGFNFVISAAYVEHPNYVDNKYDLTTLERAYRQARSGGVPSVTRIDWARLTETAPWSRQRDRNDSLATGGSQAMCYEPMFGHRLEEYPFGDLRAGSVFQSVNDTINIKNPACMLFPVANGCRPGDQFRMTEIEQARQFLSYRRFSFEMPWHQQVANFVSLATLLLAFAALGLFAMGRRG